MRIRSEALVLSPADAISTDPSQTAASRIYRILRDKIISMQMLPGTATSEQEIATIVEYCNLNEEMISTKSPLWDQSEQHFHNAIAAATHNRFFTSLMPIFNRAIHNGVILANESPAVARDTLQDHRNIVLYLQARNAEGAKIAMHLHILNTMREFGVEMD